MPKDREIPANVGDLLHYNHVTGEFFWKVNAGGICAGSPAGTKAKTGYMAVMIDRRSLMLHRIAFAIMGIDIRGRQIDHINGVRSDNRWENLRPATTSQNMRNACRSRSNNSGVTGVCWCSSSGRWRAYITDHGRPISLGRFDTLLDAAAARKSAETARGYHANHGRPTPTGNTEHARSAA